MTDRTVIQPGATLGMLGGGQLGRMFAIAAARMGFRVICFAPDEDSPAATVAHEHVRSLYEDIDAVASFAQRCDVVTLEFENIPAEAVRTAARFAPTRPGPDVLTTAQNRLRERAFLDRFGFPTSTHVAANSVEQACEALEVVGTPAVLKSATMGYDGRGQVRVEHMDDAESAWRTLGVDAALCEAWVSYEREVSVLVARSPRGEVAAFGPIENRHVRHILDISFAPAHVSDAVASDAVALAREIAAALELEGLVCVEMFATRDGGLLVNEIAPRPHNSGHLTIEGCAVSQFEQHVRAICNLPLGRMTLRRPAAMANVLGDLWADGAPDWSAALALDDVALHLYGKAEPRNGRKMGHLTCTAASTEEAIERVTEAREVAGRSTIA